MSWITKRLLSSRKVLLPICIAVCSISVDAQIDKWGYWQNGVSEPWWFSTAQFTTQQADDAIARWTKIGEEIEGTRSSEWIGSYFSGSDVHGTFLRWSHRNGFVMVHVDKCQAKVVGLTYGTVEIFPSAIEFFPQFRAPGSGHAGAHSHADTPRVTRFVPVKVDEAHLLVEQERMSAFGDYMAGLGRFNYSDFHYSFVTEFLTLSSRKETVADSEQFDEQQKKRQAPVIIVPGEYVHFVKKPIEATITRVGSRQNRKTYSYENSDGSGATYHEGVSLRTVIVSAGTAHGLRRGMFLNVVNPDEGERVRILRAGKFDSTGVIVRSLDENGGEVPFDHETVQPYTAIAAGRKLTSSPF